MDQGRYRNDGPVQEMMNKIISTVKLNEVLTVGFLRPMDIALKSEKQIDKISRSPISEKNSQYRAPSERYGLLKVETSEYGEILEFPISSIIPAQTYEQLQSHNQDNFLSLFKDPQGIQIAICIYLSNQSKTNLKQTLTGIVENILNLVASNSVNQDQIAVILMVDGLKEANRSIVDFYEQCERKSNIHLGTNVIPAMTFGDLERHYYNKTQEQIFEQQITNNTKFILDSHQFQTRTLLRLQEVKAAYQEACSLLEQIKILKQKRPLRYDLPERLKSMYMKNAKIQYGIDYVIQASEMGLISQDLIIQYFESDSEYEQKMVMKTLIEAESRFKKYIADKEELAHLAFFRHTIPFTHQHLSQISQNQNLDLSKVPLNQNQNPKKQTVMNLFFCTKYRRTGKLDTHNWFFNGFCQELQVKFGFLLESGIKPHSQALMKMYRYLKSNSTVGGVTGYITIKEEATDFVTQSAMQEGVGIISRSLTSLFDIQKVQQVEFHFNNLFSNTFSSAFGVQQSLPSSFSGYNLEIFQTKNERTHKHDNPVKYYLSPLDDDIGKKKIIVTEMGIKGAILRTFLPESLLYKCIQLDPLQSEALLYQTNFKQSSQKTMALGITRKGLSTIFLPDAYAEQRSVHWLPDLLIKKKSSANSCSFSISFQRENIQSECQPGLFFYKLWLKAINSISYFSPSIFLFLIYIATDSFRQDILMHIFSDFLSDFYSDKSYTLVVYTIEFIYVLLLLAIIFFSLHLDIKDINYRPYIYGVNTFLGVLSYVVVAVFAIDIGRGLLHDTDFLTSNNLADSQSSSTTLLVDVLRYIFIASFLIYLLLAIIYSFLFRRIDFMCETFRGIFSIIFYAPTYLVLSPIYSISQLDSLPQLESLSSAVKSSWKFIKYQQIIKLLLWNIIIGTIMVTSASTRTVRFFIAFGLITVISFIICLKSIICHVHLIRYKCKSTQWKEKVDDQSRIDYLLNTYEKVIMKNIEVNLEKIKFEYVINSNLMSLFQASRTDHLIEQSRIRHQKMSDLRSVHASKIHGFRSNTGKSKYISSQDNNSQQNSPTLPQRFNKIKSNDDNPQLHSNQEPSINKTNPQHLKINVKMTPESNPSLSVIRLSQIKQQPHGNTVGIPLKHDNFMNPHLKELPIESKQAIPQNHPIHKPPSMIHVEEVKMTSNQIKPVS